MRTTANHGRPKAHAERRNTRFATEPSYRRKKRHAIAARRCPRQPRPSEHRFRMALWGELLQKRQVFIVSGHQKVRGVLALT